MPYVLQVKYLALRIADKPSDSRAHCWVSLLGLSPIAITGLEIYDLGAGQHDLTLPVPTSIEPFRITRDSVVT